MADRSVVVRLRAETANYIAGLKAAQNATTQFGKEVANQGKAASADIERIGTVTVLAGAGIAGAFGYAVNTAANFEKKMSGVQAVSGASADEMDRLSDAALAAGASQQLAGVTASDAAAAEAELVKAGISVSDVLGGALMGSLTLASAGQLEFADAATIAAQAMNIFDLNGRDVTHIADVLAAAANKSAADVGQLGDALRQGGLVASQTGLSLEETVGALAAFGDNALIGSDAGTSLKTMLQRLTPQSEEAAALMEQLGFSAYDAYGNFIGLEGLAGELQSSLGDLTVEQRNSAMATLFGSDAVRGANVLYEQGAAGIREYVQAVDDQGAAARMAAIQNDNLKGDVEALGGALESALISNGSKATDTLRAITQGATDVVGGFSALPDTLQTVAIGLGGIVGAASLLGGGFVTLAPKIVESTTALKGMDSSLAKFAGNNLGKLTAGLAGVGVALTAGVWLYGKATQESREYATEVEGLAEALKPVAEGQADLNEEMASFFELQAAGFNDSQIGALNAFGVTMEDVRKSTVAGGDALDPLREKVRELGVDMKGVDLGKIGDKGGDATDALRNLADALGVSDEALRSLIDEMEDWDNQAQDSARKTIESAVANGDFEQSAVDAAYELNTLNDGTINYAGALEHLAPDLVETEEGVANMGGAMGEAATNAEDLKEAIEKLMEPLDTRSALDQFNAGILDMRDHFADADEAVAEARENLEDRQERLNELLAMPADQRGDTWAAQVQDARDAIVDAQADIDEAIEGTSRTLEGSSRAAIENRDMLDQLARDGVEALQAAAADESLTIQDRMGIRAILIAQMEQEAERVGLNKEQVGFYTEALRNIPLGDLTTNINLTGAEAAIVAIDNLLIRLGTLLSIGMGASVDFLQSESQLMRAQGRAAHKADGGLIPQYLAAGGFPGGPRGTDTIPVWATPGEFMMQKSAVDRFGVGLMESINRGIMPSFGGGGGGDYSRHSSVKIDAPITVSSARAAQDTSYELRKIALTAAA